MNLVDLAALAVAPAVVDAMTRLVLTIASRSPQPTAAGEQIRRWMVVIPSRSEGRHLERTVASVTSADPGQSATVIVLLDGDDETSRGIAIEHGAEIVLKADPGPSKAAALKWLAINHAGRFEPFEAVLLLDVGSCLADGFFAAFTWPPDAGASQCLLTGKGTGVASAIAQSESFSQLVEDAGRQRLGWNARLRGTGSVFRPAAFLRTASRLCTDVEDLEASLLLTADRQRIVLAPPAAAVIDEKPEDVASAAAQRARWLAGTMALLVRRFATLIRLITVRPLEGVAFAAQMLARPLSLSVAIRLAVAVLFAFHPSTMRLAVAAILTLTIATDWWCATSTRRLKIASTGQLFLAWLRAIPRIPGATYRWLKTKRSG